MTKRVLLVGDKDEFIEQAIEAWTALYSSDRVALERFQFERFQFERAEVQRMLAGKCTKAEREEIAQAALDLMD